MTVELLDVVDWRRRVFALYQQVRELAGADPAAAHAHWCTVRDDLVGSHPASPLPVAARPTFTGLPVAPYDPAYRFEVEIGPAPVGGTTGGRRRGGPVAPSLVRAMTVDGAGALASVIGAVGAAEPVVTAGPDGPAGRAEAAVATPADAEPVADTGPLVNPAGPDGPIPFARVGRVTLEGLGTLDVWSLRSYGGGVFLPVKDALAGTRTYGGGRYVLDTVKGADLGTTRGRTLVVDLNFAYNPSCAYDPAWTCPLPAAGNVIDAPVPVGGLAPHVGGAR